MRNALLIVSGVAIGLLGALVATVSAKPVMPQAEAQAGPAGGAGAANGSATIVATGGGTQNQNDLCWVLTKVKPVRGPERLVLSMYRAKKSGEYFDLEDVRSIEADIRVIEFKGQDHKRADSDFQSILKKLPKEEQDAILPPRP